MFYLFNSILMYYIPNVFKYLDTWFVVLIMYCYKCRPTNFQFHFQNNIFKQTQKLEELKSQMNWDQQALELWLEESARKDEDAMTLAKYAREDEGKIKELTLRLARLTDEAADRKKKLNNETMDTQTTQVITDTQFIPTVQRDNELI